MGLQCRTRLHPDITAARTHTLPALYKAAAKGLPTLANKGYQGAGVGVRTPVKRPTGKSDIAAAWVDHCHGQPRYRSLHSGERFRPRHQRASSTRKAG